MEPFIDWLLGGPAWVRYRTLVDLQERPEGHPDVAAARQEMLADEQVGELLADLAGWPGVPMKGHNEAGHLLHKLTFAADLGLRLADPRIAGLAEKLLSHQSEEGAFQILIQVPVHFGGSGEPEWAWMLCDAPQTVYALANFGLEDDPRVQRAARQIESLVQDNGWRCAVSSELGKFRGPGRKADPCPYATLLALKALSAMPQSRESGACRVGAETLLGLWEQRRERKPYLFAMGTDFAKLKLPLVWYDVLHVTEVLTRFPWLRHDPRLREMVSVVATRADTGGRYTPHSIWTAWKEWEFGQKRIPSRWITLKAMLILKRIGWSCPQD